MDDGHPDEGTIHAWLDGALEPGESEQLNAHVRGCAACAERVAAARGRLAGALPVVGLADELTAPVVARAEARSLWRFLRVTPTRAAIVAALIVAVGLTLARPRAAVDSPRMSTDSAVTAVDVIAAPALPSPLANDRLLDSAVARRLAIENPARVVRASPEPAAVTAAAAPPAGERMGREATAQVAAGRAAAKASAVPREAAADKLTARVPGVAVRADGGDCYRVESRGVAPYEWRGAPLPFSIALGVISAAGSVSGQLRYGVTAVGGDRMIGSWTRDQDDSLTMELTGETMTTSGRFGPGDSHRDGTVTAAGRSVAVVARRIACR